jgi:hypothetical protein
MNSTEECRMKAEAYRQAALNTRDDESRRAYLGLMAAWREIAHQVARIEQLEQNRLLPRPSDGLMSIFERLAGAWFD